MTTKISWKISVALSFRNKLWVLALGLVFWKKMSWVFKPTKSSWFLFLVYLEGKLFPSKRCLSQDAKCVPSEKCSVECYHYRGHFQSYAWHLDERGCWSRGYFHDHFRWPICVPTNSDRKWLWTRNWLVVNTPTMSGQIGTTHFLVHQGWSSCSNRDNQKFYRLRQWYFLFFALLKIQICSWMVCCKQLSIVDKRLVPKICL